MDTQTKPQILNDEIDIGLNATFMTDTRGVVASNDEETERLNWLIGEQLIEEKLRAHEGPILVDLDETLYLRNSTEEFVSLAVPSIVAAYLLRFLDMAKPWKKIGGPKCRDNWRIALILVLFPWTYLRWIQHCRTKVPTAINVELRDALLKSGNEVVIASNGYELLIRPMLKAFKMEDARLICCQLKRFSHRRDGKLALLDSAYGQDFVSKSLVVTDSFTDAPLLRVCRTPCLTIWRNAKFEHAFAGSVYLPGDYLSRVKRPRQGALRSLAIYDVIPWVLIGMSASSNIPELFGLLALFASMWSVYEIGYFDNDKCAVKYESDPKLTTEARLFNDRSFEKKAWGTAIVLGALGSYLIEPDAFILTFAIWMSVLGALFGAYWFYNRIDKTSRMWPYAALQLFRFGAVLVVVESGPVAYAACLAQVFTRWIEYIIYRYIRNLGVAEWPKAFNQTIRLLAFFILLIPIALAGQWEAFLTPAMGCLIIFTYALWKYELSKLVRTYQRLDKPTQQVGSIT